VKKRPGSYKHFDPANLGFGEKVLSRRDKMFIAGTEIYKFSPFRDDTKMDRVFSFPCFAWEREKDRLSSLWD